MPCLAPLRRRERTANVRRVRKGVAIESAPVSEKVLDRDFAEASILRRSSGRSPELENILQPIREFQFALLNELVDPQSRDELGAAADAEMRRRLRDRPATFGESVAACIDEP